MKIKENEFFLAERNVLLYRNGFNPSGERYKKIEETKVSDKRAKFLFWSKVLLLFSIEIVPKGNEEREKRRKSKIIGFYHPSFSFLRLCRSRFFAHRDLVNNVHPFSDWTVAKCVFTEISGEKGTKR